ncbi:hypothetical protein [Pseudomonas piscis]|uniref:hypothetical protein n=1 Tax=Pseudomonas piscis TaxID=2614538 RepID=UPI0021D5C134|nr:hypothetical protein [Pseudomonas piscis]MCU7646881.1 hypothetical protein [Pseudomonas piscis]
MPFKPILTRTLGILALLASAAAQAGPHKELDLRVKSDADGLEREILICARPSGTASVPGHMFLAFSTRSAVSGHRTYYTIGHTTSAPLAQTLLTYTGLIPNVSGYLTEERYTHAQEQCLVLAVNQGDYDRAFALARPSMEQIAGNMTSAGPLLLGYSLGANDCMTLAIGVAKIFPGIKVPERKATELPMDYVRRLIDSN